MTNLPEGAPAPVKRAQDYAAVGDWDGYFQAVLGKPPRETLIKALELFEAEDGESCEEPVPRAHSGGEGEGRFAVDLACGEGRDTLELLRRGWRVLALDASASGIALLRDRVPPEHAARLQTAVAPFDAANWPRCDLLNSSFALPFCPPEHFADLWARIAGSIRPGGRFAGQLFGDRDDWARCGNTLGHARPEVDTLLAAFDIEFFSEEEKDDKTALGDTKHWHVYHIVARRR